MAQGITGAGKLGRVASALAFVALLLRIAVPQGFMPSPTNPLAIVICTGHGPAMMAIDEQGKPAQPSKDKSDHVCPFAAGGGSSLTPDLRVAQTAPSRIEAIEVRGVAPDLVPGRGLAAPPPPSHAPPVFLV